METKPLNTINPVVKLLAGKAIGSTLVKEIQFNKIIKISEELPKYTLSVGICIPANKDIEKLEVKDLKFLVNPEVLRQWLALKKLTSVLFEEEAAARRWWTPLLVNGNHFEIGGVKLNE